MTFMVFVKLVFIFLVAVPITKIQASPQTLMGCTASICTSTPVVNGCVGPINCYAFNTSAGVSICSPAPVCTSFDVCSFNGSGCPSPNSVCVVDSCCSSPVCVPLSLMNMCGTITTTISTTTAAPTSVCVSTAGAAVLSSYNLITLGNLSTSSDVENRTIICGSLVSSSSANFGIHIVSNSISAASYSLELNGQIVPGNAIQVNAESFGVGTNPTHTIVANGNVGYTLDGRTVNMNGGNQGATINVEANLTAKCTSLTNDLLTLSSNLAALSNTSGNNITIPTSQSGPLNFYVNNADVNGMAVFNLVGNTVLNNPLVQQIEIIVGTSVTNSLQLVVINLSGTSISFSQGNLVGTWLTSVSTGRSHTIWNLPQATSLTINSNWMGALLAPYAVVTASVNIDGATAVLSLTTTAELHDPPIIIPPCVTINGISTQVTVVTSAHTSVAVTIQKIPNTYMMLLLFSYFLYKIFNHY